MSANLQSHSIQHEPHSDGSSRSQTGGPSNSMGSVCFVGLSNLTVLAPDIDGRGAAGEPVQQTLLAYAFARQGYRVSTIASFPNAISYFTRDGIEIFNAYEPSAGLPVVRFIHPRFTGLWRALRNADADVYYVSCAGAILGQVALFCQRYGKRFVFRVASDADCSRETLLIQYWRDKRLYEYGLRRADAILVQSEHQQRLLARNYGLASTVAGMLVEIERNAVGFVARDIDSLWVSNLRPLKRPDLYFELAGRVPQLSFHMAGGRVASESAFFDQSASRASTLANVTFHGAVPYRAMNALYRRAKVFVNTSDIEGFPNTYLQAWANGTPVIAYFDPDDIIAREGLGIAVRDEQQMHDALTRLTQDETAWMAASARCRAFIARRFADHVVLQPYKAALLPARNEVAR